MLARCTLVHSDYYPGDLQGCQGQADTLCLTCILTMIRSIQLVQVQKMTNSHFRPIYLALSGKHSSIVCKVMGVCADEGQARLLREC